jgi:hypothetical protein
MSSADNKGGGTGNGTEDVVESRPLEQSASEEMQVSPQQPTANNDSNIGRMTPQNGALNALAPRSPVTPLPNSNTSETHRRRGGHPPKHNSSPVMNTIESRASDGYGSDGRPVQPPPAHSFFNSLYDSDGSDGRYVFVLVLAFLSFSWTMLSSYHQQIIIVIIIYLPFDRLKFFPRNNTKQT